ncbi:MAG: O-antigen ligase family protein [Acidaminococcaceae bacterium]|nr:O-antigen ligase family protein [Acidaminococcaceae bacterium]
MPTLTNEKLIKYLAITVTVAACIRRLSTAVFSIANGLALLLVLYLWRQNKYSLNLSDEAKGYMKAYLIFILLMIPSVFVSDKPLVSLKEYLNFVVWRYGNIIFIAIMAFIKRRDYLVNMLTALLLTTIVDCLLTVPQSLLNMGPAGRGWGLGGNPLYLSGILCMVLPVALVIALDPAFEKRLKKAASCTVAAITAGLIFNNSRSAWLTEVLVIPPTICKYLKQQKKYVLLFVLVLAGIAAFMAAKPVYMARIRTIPATFTNRAHDLRGLVWKHAVPIIQDHPVAGVGLGRYADKYQEFRSKKIEAIKKQTQQAKAAAQKQPKATLRKPPQLDMPNETHTHNNFLQVAAETGLVGLAGFVYFCGYVLFTSLKNYRKHHNPCDKLVFLVFLSNVVIMGAFDVTFFMSPGMSFMFFLITVLLQMKTTKKPDNVV